MLNHHQPLADKVRMSLMAKDVNIVKICTTEWEVYTFYRDMPSKHGLLFSGKPYIIGEMKLKDFTNN